MGAYKNPLFALAGLIVLILAPLGQGSYIIYILCSWLIFTIAAMGLNLTLGYAGQISLAQGAFMAIGAYTVAIMTLAGWHWVIAAPIGLLLCFIVGIGLGFPALRVKGHFLAFVTLAFNTLVFLVARNEDWLTGGEPGSQRHAAPVFLAVRHHKAIAVLLFHADDFRHRRAAHVWHRPLALGARVQGAA